MCNLMEASDHTQMLSAPSVCISLSPSPPLSLAPCCIRTHRSLYQSEAETCTMRALTNSALSFINIGHGLRYLRQYSSINERHKVSYVWQRDGASFGQHRWKATDSFTASQIYRLLTQRQTEQHTNWQVITAPLKQTVNWLISKGT